MAEIVQQDNTETAEEQQPRRERKRKRKDDNEDLEAKYLAELTKDDAKEPQGKRQKAEAEAEAEAKADGQEERGDDANPTHESLCQESKDADLDIEKANRTVFLSNVSIDTISSKSAKKALIAHLSSALDPNETPAQKFESIRFRSVAFSTGSMPKRAAYITKSLMGATTKSANAYAVFSTPAAARLVAAKLNGSEILGRHIRVDSVAHPSPTDHRRCVFVGNLGFVDDETIVNTNEDGEKVEKKRTKVPADAEEGLWRTFSKAGKVENVRVVRDPKTRVGKGFAYVQFYVSNCHVFLKLEPPSFFFGVLFSFPVGFLLLVFFSLSFFLLFLFFSSQEKITFVRVMPFSSYNQESNKLTLSPLPGHQRRRSGPPPRWQKVPASAASHSARRPSQGPP